MAHLAGVKDADRERVLRFNCVWDNTKSVFGEKLAFALHYYMSDGTVEIREVHMRNSGREPFPLLLSRRKLPKTTPPVCELGRGHRRYMGLHAAARLDAAPASGHEAAITDWWAMQLAAA